MSEPLVSVIIPVYNVEKQLHRCLDSVLGQNYSEMEILCVDDCSTDGSRQILEEYASKYSNITILSYETNRRPGGARDFGLLHAKGDYVQYVDSDDYIAEDFLKQYMKYAVDDVDIIMGGLHLVNGDKVTTTYMVEDHQHMQWIHASTCIKIFRRQFLVENDLNFHGVKHYEDGPFNLRVMMCDPKISFINYAGYYYVCNTSSVTKTGDQREKYLEYVDNYYGLKDEINDLECDEDVRQMLEYEFVQGLTICMLAMVRHMKWKTAKEFRELRKKRLTELFPNYMKNAFIGFHKLPKEFSNIRVCLTIYMMAERLKLDGFLLWVLSL